MTLAICALSGTSKAVTAYDGCNVIEANATATICQRALSSLVPRPSAIISIKKGLGDKVMPNHTCYAFSFELKTFVVKLSLSQPFIHFAIIIMICST